ALGGGCPAPRRLPRGVGGQPLARALARGLRLEPGDVGRRLHARQAHREDVVDAVLPAVGTGRVVVVVADAELRRPARREIRGGSPPLPGPRHPPPLPPPPPRP